MHRSWSAGQSAANLTMERRVMHFKQRWRNTSNAASNERLTVHCEGTKSRDAWDLGFGIFSCCLALLLPIHNNHANPRKERAERPDHLLATIMAATRRVLSLMVLCLLLLATLVSANSSSSSASSVDLNSSIESLSDHDEDIAEVLTKLEEQVEVALDKLGSAAAEIDINVIFDDDSSGSDLMSQFQDDNDDGEDERFGDDEWAVIVPRINSVPVPVLPFDDDDFGAKQDGGERGAATAFATGDETPLENDEEAVPHAQRRPEWREQQEQQRDDATDWAALFAPHGWGVDSYQQFDQRQLLGPANLAVLTTMTCVAMLLVLGVWSLSIRSQRRRAAERQSQWAASVELLDSMPYFDNSIV